MGPFVLNCSSAPTAQARRMVRAELMGRHTHCTLCGIQVHVWQRGEQYLVRGSYQGRMFGKTLGRHVAEAVARLRRLLTEIDDGAFVRPSEARTQALSNGQVPRLSLRQLVNEFLAEKRKLRGRQTAASYLSRLWPVLDFAEQPATCQRWPLALDIDHRLGVELRAFLFQCETTRNGRAGGKPKPLSVRQVKNVLECLRSALSWARQAEVRKLPVSWANHVTADLIPAAPAKDPLRDDPLPLAVRSQLVSLMDRWQLLHLSLSIVLPLRPEEAAGLLISDVAFDKGWLEIGTRLAGGDFTKARTSFKLPFPDEMRPLLRACIGGRGEGPLLRSRKALAGRGRHRGVASFEELARLFQEGLAKEPHGRVQTEQDRKQVFRRLLRRLGGVSEDQLAAECKELLKKAGVGTGVSLYTLRSPVTTAMKQAKLPHLELRYLTSHTTSDILNEYVSLDPVGAMGQYFAAIRPLLEAITQKAQALGITSA